MRGRDPWAPLASIAVALAILPAGPSRAAEGWEPAAPDADGDWLVTFLDEADFHEEAFNLGAALRRYRQACELTPPGGAGTAWWNDWVEGCEGMVDAAFALEDWTALDQALRRRAGPDVVLGAAGHRRAARPGVTGRTPLGRPPPAPGEGARGQPPDRMRWVRPDGGHRDWREDDRALPQRGGDRRAVRATRSHAAELDRRR